MEHLKDIVNVVNFDFNKDYLGYNRFESELKEGQASN